MKISEGLDTETIRAVFEMQVMSASARPVLFLPLNAMSMPKAEAGAPDSAPNTSQDMAVTMPRVELYFPGQKYPLYFDIFYVSLLLLLAIPYFQRK
jgi:hypothetical protein